eukprot:Opistho-2@35870
MGLFTLFQLARIVYYRHKKLSYQSMFLSLCFLWAVLRTVLFGLTLITNWSLAVYRFIYCVPITLQFATFSLLVLYFAQVVHKTKWQLASKALYKRILLSTWMLSNVAFFSVNITCVAIVGNRATFPKSIAIARVAVNETLFLLLSAALVVYMFRVMKLSSASVLLQAKGTSLRQVVLLMALMAVLFTSRAVYNIVAVATNLTSFVVGNPRHGSAADHFDFDDNKTYSYAFLCASLFLWEILPTFAMVWFFRVKKPRLTQADTLHPAVNPDLPDGGARTYFFDNPKRYESDSEDGDTVHPLVYNSNPYDIPASLPYGLYHQGTPPYHGGGAYGSLARSHSHSYSSSSRGRPGSSHGQSYRSSTDK